MTQKGKKQVKSEDFRIIEANPEVLIMDNPHFVEGLRILAHCIARAYLKDQREKISKRVGDQKTVRAQQCQIQLRIRVRSRIPRTKQPLKIYHQIV